MILTVELQCQFPVGDVPSGAVKRGGVLSANYSSDCETLS